MLIASNQETAHGRVVQMAEKHFVQLFRNGN
jgi:hypothetical protein